MSHQTKNKKNVFDKVKKVLISFSYQEQKNKELEKFVWKKNQLLNMSCDEIDLTYFKCKAELEHKKMMLPLFLISILVAIIMNWWKYFYNFVETMLKYSANQFSLGNNEMENVQVIVLVFTVFIIVITVIILIYIIMYIKRIYLLSREIMLIEDVRNKMNGEG